MNEISFEDFIALAVAEGYSMSNFPPRLPRITYNLEKDGGVILVFDTTDSNTAWRMAWLRYQLGDFESGEFLGARMFLDEHFCKKIEGLLQYVNERLEGKS